MAVITRTRNEAERLVVPITYGSSNYLFAYLWVTREFRLDSGVIESYLKYKSMCTVVSVACSTLVFILP